MGLEEPLQIPPTRAPRRRKRWPRKWRITALVVGLALTMIAASLAVNNEVNHRLATIPGMTTSTSVTTSTTSVPRPTQPHQLPRTDPVVAVASPTTTTSMVVAQEVPKSAYDIITKLDALPVADEYTLGYARYRYGAWRDDNGDGCDTRFDVTVQQGKQVVSHTNPCDIVSGEWLSPYDGYEFNDPEALVVDHVVGLYEAWKSGAYNWTDAQRNNYLNDVKDLNLLLAVSKTSVQDKAGRDPKDWLPSNAAYRCRYLQTWVDVKTVWKLSVDAGEREAIAAAALNC